ncbi:hypothetical protein KM043_015888 [Ampulex compressa]|nr:hypothetical protein KM043_015888 [Ampulex compressa]
MHKARGEICKEKTARPSKNKTGVIMRLRRSGGSRRGEAKAKTLMPLLVFEELKEEPGPIGSVELARAAYKFRPRRVATSPFGGESHRSAERRPTVDAATEEQRRALFVAEGIPRCRLSPETFITARRLLGITNVFEDVGGPSSSCRGFSGEGKAAPALRRIGNSYERERTNRRTLLLLVTPAVSSDSSLAAVLYCVAKLLLTLLRLRPALGDKEGSSIKGVLPLRSKAGAGKDRVESQWRDGLPTRGRVRIDQSGNYCHRNITRDVTHDEGRAASRPTPPSNAAALPVFQPFKRYGPYKPTVQPWPKIYGAPRSTLRGAVLYASRESLWKGNSRSSRRHKEDNAAEHGQRAALGSCCTHQDQQVRGRFSSISKWLTFFPGPLAPAIRMSRTMRRRSSPGCCRSSLRGVVLLIPACDARNINPCLLVASQWRGLIEGKEADVENLWSAVATFIRFHEQITGRSRFVPPAVRELRPSEFSQKWIFVGVRGRLLARPFVGHPVAWVWYLAEEVTRICGRSLFGAASLEKKEASHRHVSMLHSYSMVKVLLLALTPVFPVTGALGGPQGVSGLLAVPDERLRSDGDACHAFCLQTALIDRVLLHQAIADYQRCVQTAG